MAALLNVPKTARPGEIIEIKTLMSHPMVTGYGRDDEGKPMARDIIRQFVCRYDGEEVFRLELTQAIASNPFIVFSTRATQTGTLVFEWTDEKGETWREIAVLTVT
ncbi:thiosulfate oxidation carrier complex protein SoxZ [Phreatobacter aquaticus]|uniref:Thiosulfate oxidation carrier complex protein SoxZ n=1 Tax=Phreatobacter aquaticus TaxID=2570229 RepID=A0A4D7QTX0_9HYPH|nr:thiosulfate oxidation carrier complex protein SoxZ [Phreatobacter aquaticus]QCK87432.1 thiosulfate oxidation carrier complex protein SoxZ [Phreatobacter aquaticus]